MNPALMGKKVEKWRAERAEALMVHRALLQHRTDLYARLVGRHEHEGVERLLSILFNRRGWDWGYKASAGCERAVA